MSQGSKAAHLPQLRKIRLLPPFLTLNRPGFSESSKARGQIPIERYFKIFLKMSHHNRQHFTIEIFISMHFYNRDLHLYALLLSTV